ncbi:MAG: sulfite exporter TauE/SafE family protein [Pelagibacterales bacterium]|nr:sulfite exporter TauE/SafE family protein [Pelagibacterales bacterium]
MAQFLITKKLSDLKTAFFFAIPSVITVFITRTLIIPNLPEKILYINKNSLLMIFFAFLMLVAGFLMLKSELEEASPKLIQVSKRKIIYISSAIGLLTGLVGAGGGFLIVPALTKFLKIDIKKLLALR